VSCEALSFRRETLPPNQLIYPFPSRESDDSSESNFRSNLIRFLSSRQKAGPLAYSLGTLQALAAKITGKDLKCSRNHVTV
jgi:hypothetical protein